jgi:hypothetical protein
MPANAPPGPVMKRPSNGPWLASGFRSIGPKNPAVPPTTPSESDQKPAERRSAMGPCSAAIRQRTATCITFPGAEGGSRTAP